MRKFLNKLGFDIFKSRDKDYPKEGRISLYYKEKVNLRFAWNLWSQFLHLQFDVDRSEAEVGWSVAIPPIAIWFTLGGKQIYQLIKNCVPPEFEYRVSFHDTAVWWNFGTDPNCWKSQTPVWKQGSFHFDDFILGAAKFSKELLGEPTNVVIYLGEGSYRGICQLEHCSWKRPRWFKDESTYANIKMLDPIPVPGKGENSWDCDEDALYGISVAAKTVSEATGKLISSVLVRREKYGSLNWKPNETCTSDRS